MAEWNLCRLSEISISKGFNLNYKSFNGVCESVKSQIPDSKFSAWEAACFLPPFPLSSRLTLHFPLMRATTSAPITGEPPRFTSAYRMSGCCSMLTTRVSSTLEKMRTFRSSVAELEEPPPAVTTCTKWDWCESPTRTEENSFIGLASGERRTERASSLYSRMNKQLQCKVQKSFIR